VDVNELEKEIEVRLWERTVTYIRYALLIAAFLFVAFLGWDMLLYDPDPWRTLVARLVAAAYFLTVFYFVTWTDWGRRWIKPIYVLSIPVASLLIVWVLVQTPGAYVIGHGSFLAVTIVVILIGPNLRTSVPLAVVSLVLPNAVTLWLIDSGAVLPGLPDAVTAVNLALIDLGVGVIAVALMVVHYRLHRHMLLDNLHLEQLAGTDPLTSVHNRRQLEHEFHRETARRRRHGRPIGMLELDLDHFKAINDRFGHGVGDEVLRDLARRWRSLIRETDELARIGGEEFIVLIPEADEQGVRESAERLREHTAAEPVSTSAGPMEITVSIGATLSNDDQESLGDVLNRVDRAMYEAKRNGRNRYEYAPPDQAKTAAVPGGAAAVTQ